MESIERIGPPAPLEMGGPDGHIGTMRDFLAKPRVARDFQDLKADSHRLESLRAELTTLARENILCPDDLVAPRLWSRLTRIAWVRATDGALVPAQAVYCPPQGSAPLGPAVFRWSTNGMGAHPVARLALQHAVLEVRERDQLARALPHGWTPRAISARKLDASSLPLWQQLR